MARARIKSAMRAWFEARGFVEVETACLQISPGNETHLHAFGTQLLGSDLSVQPYYLHTSPEFACKKLLAAGEEKIFTFAPVFRNRERGALHHPEFMMLEWYRVGDCYEQVMRDTLELVEVAANVVGTGEFQYRSRSCNPRADAHYLSVNDAFSNCAKVDLGKSVSVNGTDRAALAFEAEKAGIIAREDDGWSDLFSRILAASVEPELGIGRPTILKDYPIAEAALARPSPDDATVANRFELYCCGVELANGFDELTDPVEQRVRFQKAMDDKQDIYGDRYPIDQDFLNALQHMPAAAGVALGFDRLVMLATRASNVDAVIWTPLPQTS